MSTKHTQTPWHLDEEDEPCIRSSVGDMVGRTYVGADFPYLDAEERDEADETAMANAAFIVRAVNAHDALVSALKVALPALERTERDNERDAARSEMAPLPLPALIAVRAALKLARGEA